jgi:hypothetical protein
MRAIAILSLTDGEICGIAEIDDLFTDTYLRIVAQPFGFDIDSAMYSVAKPEYIDTQVRTDIELHEYFSKVNDKAKE